MGPGSVSGQLQGPEERPLWMPGWCVKHYHEWQLTKEKLYMAPGRETSGDAESGLTLQTTHLGPAPKSLTPKIENAQLPTWGQLKKLSQAVKYKLCERGLTKTNTNMLVSMMAVLALSSGADNKPSNDP